MVLLGMVDSGALGGKIIQVVLGRQVAELGPDVTLLVPAVLAEQHLE